MKKITISIITLALLMLTTSTAFAGYWQDWSEHEIEAYGYFTVYFTPCVAGDHQISFIDEEEAIGGTVELAWADISEMPLIGMCGKQQM